MTKVIILGLALAAILVVQQYVYARIWLKQLTVRLEFDRKEMFEGDKGVLKQIITNGKKTAIPVLTVKFQTSRSLAFDIQQGSNTTDRFYRSEVFQIGGGEKITRSLGFTALHRGYYVTDQADLVAHSLFFKDKMYESLQVHVPLYVFPAPLRLPEFRSSLQRLNGEILVKRHMLEDPFEFRGIREYEPYDDMRTINWKASAKTGEYKVNQKNYTARNHVQILVNTDDRGVLHKEDELETCIRIAAGLAEYFIGQGMQVSCYCNGADLLSGQKTEIEESGGEGQLHRILQGLARIDLQAPAENFLQAFEEQLLQQTEPVMTFFCSANGYSDFVELLERYAQSGREFVWYYPSKTEQEEVPASIKGRVELIKLH